MEPKKKLKTWAEANLTDCEERKCAKQMRQEEIESDEEAADTIGI